MNYGLYKMGFILRLDVANASDAVSQQLPALVPALCYLRCHRGSYHRANCSLNRQVRS